MGRKPLSDSRKLGSLLIRVTDFETELIESASKIVGKPKSTWARDELLRLAAAIVSEDGKATESKKKSASRKK